MSCLPNHGRVPCTLCYKDGPVTFDVTRRTEGNWRITANPLAWGNPNAEIVVLGFSKGPRQAGALASAPHDEIPFKGGRKNVGKILAHLGLIPKGDANTLKRTVSELIASKSGRFHFGSLIRCTVERYNPKRRQWEGSGGGMLDRFVVTPFGQEVSRRCSDRFLGALPARTRLVVMFGLGVRGNYVREVQKLLQQTQPGSWRLINEVAYTNGKVTFVHVEHLASQGALIPNWLGETPHPRARLGILAREAAQCALADAPVAASP